MSRTLVLVEFTWSRDKDPRLPLGHASLLAAVRQERDLIPHSVVVPVNHASTRPSAVVDRILSHVPGDGDSTTDIALGVYVWGEELAQRVLPLLRRRGFRGRIILGGPQISYVSAGLEQIYPDADAFVRGYGEAALRQLTRSHHPIALPGVHWAGAHDERTQAAIDLQALPSPWLSGLIPLDGQSFVRWETQRGCAFACSFCQHREAGQRLVKRSLCSDRIAAEVDLFCRSGVRDIAVLDPTFNMGAHAVDVLQRFAGGGYDGRLSLQCRAESTRPAFLDAASALHTHLEFGLQSIHREEGKAIRRTNHLARVDEVLANVRRAGISHEVSLIFGLPRQTLSSFEASIAWCLERHVPVIKAFPLLLLRGTALDRERARYGLIAEPGAMPKVIASASFDHDEWLQMARLSEALAATEGRHPTSIRTLRALAAELSPDDTRWRPAPLKEAA